MAVEIFRPPKIVIKPYCKPFYSLKWLVVHLFEPFGGPFRTFPAESSRVSNGPPPKKKFRQIWQHKIFYICITLFKNVFNRLHRVPEVEIRYLTCLTRNFQIQNFRLFSGFSDFDWWVFLFCYIGVGAGTLIRNFVWGFCPRISKLMGVHDPHQKFYGGQNLKKSQNIEFLKGSKKFAAPMEPWKKTYLPLSSLFIAVLRNDFSKTHEKNF